MGLTKPRAAQIYDIDYKQATRVVTVSDINLTGGAPNQVDGVNLAAGDRILVIGNDPASENGIYLVATLGSGSNGTWTRTLDTDISGELLAGTIVMVTEGLVYHDTQWKLTTDDPIVIGVSDLIFEQNSAFAFGNVYANGTAVLATSVGDVLTLTAGNNIQITGNNSTKTVNIGVTGISLTSIANGTSNVNVTGSGSNVTVGVGGTDGIATFATTGEYITGVLSASGNVTGNYLLGNASQVTGVNAFSTIAVSGEDTIFANSIASTLTIAAGNNIVVTTSNTSGIVTIAYSSGGGGSSIFSTGGDMGLVTDSVTSSEDLGLVTDASSISYDLGQLGVEGVVSNSDIIANTITGDKINSATYISVTGNLTAANLALTSSTSDVRGWSYNTQVTIADKEQSPTGIALNSAGTKMYFVGTTNKTVYQFGLSTAFNISTATYSTLSFSVASEDTSPQDVRINSAGTTMWVLGGTNDKIFQYSISSGDVSTASYGNLNLSVSAQEATPTGFTLTPDGANAYVIGTTNCTVYQYTLSSAGNIATGTYSLKSFSVASQDTAPVAIQFNATGSTMWILGDANNSIYQYTLSDPFNVTTAVYYGKFYIGDQEPSPHGLWVDIAGGAAYMLGQAQDIVYQYRTGDSTIATSNSLFHTSSTVQLAGNIYAAGNVTGGNILTAGNVTSSYFIGNGSALTGITSTPPPLNINLQQNYGGF